MIVWLAMLLIAGARAGDEDVRELQREVAELAAAVGRARTEGARRQVVEGLMASYRARAQVLQDLLEPLQAAEQDERRRARAAALTAVIEATARGQRDLEARQVLAAWIGAADGATVERLSAALDQAEQDPILGEALRADVAEVAGALAVCATYDAAEAGRDAARDAGRAAALRAAARSGTPEALEGVADAERLEREAAAATTRQQEAVVVEQAARRVEARAAGTTP
ncbi:MAG: hypothetical protein H6738_10775 [Alphaproteobacteria bacterium]|nr:hypothetical protein [Alphaproteobacteria bacterium]MCB9697254.1 hypothetical protein [Alphaproteobacteria bacterium]